MLLSYTEHSLSNHYKTLFLNVLSELYSLTVLTFLRKPVFGLSTRSNTNWPVQSLKMTRSLKFRIKEEEKL